MMRLSIILAAMLLLASAMAVNAAYIAGPAIAWDEVLEPTQSAYYVQPDQTVTFTAYAIDIDYWGDPTNYYDAPLHLTWTGTDIAVGPVHSTLYEVYREGELLPLQECELQKSWSTEGTKTIHLKVDDHPHYANDVQSLEMDFVDVIVDGTPPTLPTVTDDGEWTANSSQLHATWSATDSLSGIDEYQYAIGASPTDPGSGYVVGWTSVGTATEVTATGLSLDDRVTYYFYVKARDKVDLWSDVGVSDGIKVILVYDAEDEFSIEDNPTGTWRYVWSPDLDEGYENDIELYDTPTTSTTPPTTGLEKWYSTTYSTAGDVTHNPTGSEISDGQGTTWPAHTLACQPGSAGQKAIVRWTAPLAGVYLVSARFWDITDGYTSTDVHVLYNCDSIFDGEITNLHEGTEPRASKPSQTFSTVLTLSAGDTIDFAVGRGDDSNSALDTTGLEARIAPVADSEDIEYDHGLPTDPNKLNEAAGANRCNIRWTSTDSLSGYGDDYFVLPAETEWVVDTIRVWTVPQVPITPSYCLGQHYQSVTLYGGVSGQALSALAAGSFLDASNFTTNRNISIMPVQYQGGYDYQRAGGDYNQIWQIDFNHLDLAIDGGTTYVFGVHGAPHIDRLWFNHATNSALCGWSTSGDGLLKYFDTENLANGASSADGSVWFGGKGSDVNIQVFAHPVQ